MGSKLLLQIGVGLWVAAVAVFVASLNDLTEGGMRLDGVLAGFATKGDVLAGALLISGAVLVSAGSRNRL